jgi:hypothetical protein
MIEGLIPGFSESKLFGRAQILQELGPGCSLIGISKSSILETDALAGVTVLSGVGFRSPHHGCQG